MRSLRSRVRLASLGFAFLSFASLHAAAQTITVVAGAPAVSGANLITNGDFQTGTSCFPADYIGPLRPGGGTAIAGWTAGGGGRDTYARIVCGSGAITGNSVYFGNGYVRNVSPAIGAAALTFDANNKLVGALPTFTLRTIDTQAGDPNCCDWGSSGGPVTLAQTVATTSGRTYRLRFDTRSEGSVGAAQGVWRVQIGSGTVDIAVPPGTENNLSYTLEFVANAATTTVTFINWGHIGNSSGGFCDPTASDYCSVGGLVGAESSEPTLDNVQLVEVPTPVIGIAKQAGSVINNLDGTFSVPITLVVRNYGNENLSSVTVSDALNGASPAFGTYTAGTPGYGQYTIQTAPAFSGACATLAITAGFTGSTGTQQVASGTLATSTACTITYTIKWFPSAQTTFTTQASAAGTGAVSSTATSDTSDDGSNPDPDGDSNPNESGENDPTTVSVPAGSAFACGTIHSSGGGTGAATSTQINSVSGGGFSANLTGLPFATAAIAIDSSGRLWYAEYFAGGGAARLAYFDPATNVHTITSASFPGGAAAILRMSINNGGTAYVIDNSNNMYSFTVGASPTISSLGALSFAAASPSGTTSSGDFAFDLSGNAWAIFGNSLYTVNTATLVASPIGQLKLAGVPLGTATTIIGGLAFDGLNRMHVSVLDTAGGTGTVYAVTLATLELTSVATIGKALSDLGSCTIVPTITPPRVDVVKSAGTVTAVSATVFDIPFTVRVASQGQVPAPNVQVNDYLPGVFSSGSPTIAIQTAPAVTAGSCTANAAFNGNADTRLLSGTNTLSAGTSCTITFTVRLTYGAVGSIPSAAQNNTAYASSHPASPNAGYTFPGGTATAPSGAWSTDQSTNGSSFPGTANGDAPSPTPVILSGTRVGVARQAGSVTNNLDGTFTVPFTVVVRNYASEALNAVTLTDPLNGASPLFGTYSAGTPSYGQYTISTAPAFSGACATLTLTAGFTGNTGTQQLASGTLPVSGACTITYSVRFFPAAQTTFTTQTTAAGTGATTSTATTDTSDDGSNPDTDGDNNPNEAGENDPTTVTVPTGSALSCNGIITTGGTAGTNLFSEINSVNTGAGTLSANLTGLAFNTFAIGTDPTGRIWYVEAPAGGGNARIAYFDPTTNVHTITASVVPIAAGFTALRLGIDSAGTAYVVDNQAAPRLYSFTTVASPVVSTIGAITFAAASPSGSTASGDLAVDQSGRLWAVFGNALYQIDSATAVATPLGQFTLGGVPYSTATGLTVGLAFDSSGRMYIAVQPAAGNGEIYEVNKSTLAMTIVVTAGSAGKAVSDLSSCASPTFTAPTIDVIKSVGSVSAVSATVFDVPYTVRVANLSTFRIPNVQANDYLPSTFSSGSPTIAIQTAPAVTSGSCTANAAFNGNADTKLLAGTNALDAGASCTITFTVRLTYAAAGSVPSAAQNNSAYASTHPASPNTGHTYPGGTPTAPTGAWDTDQSTNGTTLPGTPNGDAPSVTPVTLTGQRIDVVKAAGSVTQVSALVFDVPYTVRVGNLGTTASTNVQVNDYLPGTFSSGSPSIAIQTAPAVTAGGCTANGAFNGNADTRLLAGTDSLAASASCTITFTVRLTYASTGVIPSAAQNNSAYASTAAAANSGYTFPGGTATPPGAALATDQSTNGNALPGSAGGDATSVTPVSLPVQRIDVVKSVAPVTTVSATVFDVPYTVRVGNLGTVTATNVQVNDYLPGVFSSGTPSIAIQTAPAVTSGGCTANGAFNGNADTRLLAGTDTLAASATCVITFTVRVTYAAVGSVPSAAQNNSAYASTAAAANSGYTFPGGTATAPGAALATDQSTNGSSFPGSANGDTASVTPVTFSSQRIDVVKAAGSVSIVSGLVFDVPYTVRVGNLGTVTATNVQVNDYLPSTFSSGAPTIAIQAAPAVTAGGCTANAAFNGNADTRLVAGTDSLAASASCTITFTVRVTYASAAAIPASAQNNTAYASTTAAANNGYSFPGGTATAPPAAIATDVSSNASALPGSAGGDAPSPTPVTLAAQRLDVVLAAGTVTRVSSTAYDIPYTAIVKNTGTITATNVQVNDYLPGTFAGGAPTIAIQTAPAVTAGGCTAGAGYNGNATTALLAGTDSLGANASCTITFTVRVTYPSIGVIPSGVLNNSAYASSATSGPNTGYTFPGGSATAPGAALATDTSTDGSTLPVSANGDTPTPTPVTLPSGTATLSGYVWIDSNKNRTLDPGETVVPDFGVEITNAATGTIVECTALNNPAGAGGCITVGGRSLFRTGTDGQYRITGLVPGAYQVRFRDPANTVIFTTPVNGSSDPAASVDSSGAFITVNLTAGANITQQSLPLDPAGVVYNSTTRAVVPGATVTFCGPAGFNPATMLIGSGYTISGNCASMVTGATGAYQYLLNGSALGGTYTVGVVPPAGFIAPSIAIPPQTIALSPPGGPGQYLVQAQSGPPTGGDPTTYYLAINLTAGSRDVLNNHIPVDPITGTSLFVAKAATAQVVELGDSVGYTITVRNPTAGVIASVVMADTLPPGFRYLPGTVRVNGAVVSDPAGSPGPVLTLPLGALVSNQVVTITYRVRVGVGALQGDGVNRVAASGGGGVTSNVATAKVRVTGGVFTNEACVVGKIYSDCNRNSIQDSGELGIPGVRLYFSDGTFVISDSEGKYSYCGLEPRTYTFKVDRTTLPRGSRLTTSSNRNALDPNSLFLDLKAGELHQADFIEGSCTPEVANQIRARRAQGEVRAPETEKRGGPALIFDTKPGETRTPPPRPRFQQPGAVQCRTDNDCDRPLEQIFPRGGAR